MGPILLTAGLLLAVYGGAALSGSHVASDSRMRRRGKPYAVASLMAGIALMAAGVVALTG